MDSQPSTADILGENPTCVESGRSFAIHLDMVSCSYSSSDSSTLVPEVKITGHCLVIFEEKIEWQKN